MATGTGCVAGTGSGTSVTIRFSLLLAFVLPILGVDKPGNGFNPS
jgi:hypothetical protein